MGEGDREALIMLWEASDRLCSKRLKPLIPVFLPALDRHGRISQGEDARARLVAVRLHEEFKRRIKTQCLLPCAYTAAMLFWALLASGQITMRRVDGRQNLERSLTQIPE